MNYFNSAAAAERYSKGRPRFHSNTIKHIRDYLQLDEKVDSALDVGCGTGLSTEALLQIARNVYGTDISERMLEFAIHKDRIRYLVAAAEQQPFADSTFDLITVSSGVHWFDIDKFLTEANRLLKSKSWLAIYENHFIAEMVGVDEFADWFASVYLKKFPSPPRNNAYAWNAENLKPKNLVFLTEEKFKNSVRLSKSQLALYFTTQSNIIAAVEKGEVTYPQVEKWLNEQLALFFKDDGSPRTINYGNWIKYFQRMDQ